MYSAGAYSLAAGVVEIPYLVVQMVGRVAHAVRVAGQGASFFSM